MSLFVNDSSVSKHLTSIAEYLHSAPFAICVFDLEGKLLFLNQNVMDTFHIEQESDFYDLIQLICLHQEKSFDVFLGEIKKEEDLALEIVDFLHRQTLYKKLKITAQLKSELIWLNLRSVETYQLDINKELPYLKGKLENSIIEEQSEGFWRSILDYLPINIYIKDVKGNKVYVNRTEKQFLQELNAYADSIQENNFYKTNILQLSKEEDNYVIQSGKSIINKESSFQLSSGDRHWYLINKIPLRSDQSKVIGILGISYDITHQKLFQIELQNTQEQFKLAIEGSNDGIWDWDVKTGNAYFSPRWKSQLGYNDEELDNSYETFRSLIHEDDLDSVLSYLKDYIEGRIDRYSIELRMRHKSGDYRWILARGKGIKNEKGKVIRMLGSHSDITERKIADAELKKTKEILEVTGAISRTGAWSIDLSTQEIYWSRITRAIHEVSEDYIPDLQAAILFFKEGYNRNRIAELVDKAIKHGDAYNEELVLVTSNQREVWVRCMGSVEFENGKCKRVYGSIQDIDDQKKLELENQKNQTALKESYGRIKELTDAITDILWSYSMTFEGEFVRSEITAQADELLELPKGTVNNNFDVFFSYIHPDDFNMVFIKFQEGLFNTEKVMEMEYRIITPSKKVKWLLSRGYSVKHGNIIKGYGSTTDITTRKIAEETLEQQASFLALLMDITTKNINLPVDEINESIQDSLGRLGQFFKADRCYLYDYDFVKGVSSNTFEWCASGTSPKIDQQQEVPIEVFPLWVILHLQGKSFQVEDVNQLEPSDGKSILQMQKIKSLITMPLLDKGDCVGFIGFDYTQNHHKFSHAESQLIELYAQLIVNIRKRSILERNLIAAKEDAERANSAKSEFLANMSHEIRTPLNGVIGFTELLINTQLSPEQKQYVESANTSAVVLMGIINDILDFSKIEAGKLELDESMTDIHELIDQTTDLVKYNAASKGLELILNIPIDTPRYVHIDPLRLKQILVNLLSNAVKFTNTGEVEIRVLFEKEVNTDTLGSFTFSVRDTGIGISQDQQTKLFKSFSQADTSTTRNFGGTGLGLIIAQMLAQKMGGNISLQSKTGEGSVFQFTIHRNFEKGAPIRPKSLEKIKRVLIIDDNENNRIILEHTFEYWGIKTVATHSGTLAMLLLQSDQNFDLIISDYHMPQYDGLSVLKDIQNLYNSKSLPPPFSILYTSVDNHQVRDHAHSMGVTATLVKPAKHTDLINCLNRLESNTDFNAELDSEAPSQQATENSYTLSGTILVAEDVPLNFLLVKTYLKSTFPDMKILSAENGKQACELFKENEVNLILMDLQMPEMDGYSATDWIRQYSEQGKSVPIIALTAGATDAERQKCLQYGMTDFLTKPIYKSTLTDTILKHWK
jgi:PAS domain S-box-containing protein